VRALPLQRGVGDSTIVPANIGRVCCRGRKRRDEADLIKHDAGHIFPGQGGTSGNYKRRA
jgi:hypothetical protein